MPVMSVSPHRGRRRFLGLAGVAALLPWQTTLATMCNDRTRSWQPCPDLLEDLPRAMAAFAVPGVAIAIVEDGAVAWQRGFGVLHAERGTAVDEATLFEVASLSKPVFAYLVLQLSDAGVLDLDRPLVAYRRPGYLGDSPWLERITARDVLRHTTGLPNWRAQPATERLVPTVDPGTRIDYSGEAFVWLQLVVETLTGESLDTTAQTRLFGPADMRDSSYAWSVAMAARSVYGHRAHDADAPGMPPQMLREQWSAAQTIADRDGVPLSDWTWAEAARALPAVQADTPPGLVNWPGDILANAAASLRCTVGDYARFLTLSMTRGAQRAPWEISEATRQTMLTPQAIGATPWSAKGLGWNIEPTADGPVFHHAGSNGGIFKNFALGDAARRRGIVVLTNGGSGQYLYRRIVRAATGLDLLAFDR